MSGTATAASADRKRKRPPTFQHLPLNRAKKLKQSWVEVQKIKSKWKAQKRKEGILLARRTLPTLETDAEEQGLSEAGREDQEKSRAEQEDSDSAPVAESSEEEDGHTGLIDQKTTDESESGDSDKESISKPEPREQARRSRGRSRGRGSRGNPYKRDVKDGREEDKVSLRELQNQAYSRSSLHNFKSTSLHRRGSDAKYQDRGRGRGRGAQRDGGRGHGRGQPDMRLRMNAMLEKIKRDYA